MSHPKILVVDDDPFSLELLAAMLSEAGLEVARAVDGPSALRCIAEQPPDLVLLDVAMPGMSGIDVCREARKLRRALPIIFVTAVEDREARRAGKEAGADDFLAKPVDEVELFARMHNLFEAKAYHDLREHHARNLATELDRARGQVLDLERMATLGTLAACVGHELNNVASVIGMTLEAMRNDIAAGRPTEPEDLDTLAGALGHVALHGQQLMTLGRHHEHADEQQDVRPIIDSTLAMLAATGRTKYVRVEYRAPAEPLLLTVNKVRLEQVLVNLVLNAADACRSPGGRAKGRITLTVARDPSSAALVLSVRDNGAGIAPQDYGRIFEPYFTTKPPGQGTGLGLAVVRQIVEGYRGTVEVSSELGAGTAFTLRFPVEV